MSVKPPVEWHTPVKEALDTWWRHGTWKTEADERFTQTHSAGKALKMSIWTGNASKGFLGWGEAACGSSYFWTFQVTVSNCCSILFQSGGFSLWSIAGGGFAFANGFRPWSVSGDIGPWSIAGGLSLCSFGSILGPWLSGSGLLVWVLYGSWPVQIVLVPYSWF